MRTANTADPPAYSPGLDGVLAGETALCHVDEGEGGLSYRGYDVRELAENSIFEEVAYLLFFGKLPTRKELNDFSTQLAAHCMLPGPVETFLDLIPPAAHPMDILRTSVSLLGITDPDASDGSHDAKTRKAIRLMAQIPLIIATAHRFANGKCHVRPQAGLSFAENLLFLLTDRRDDDTARAMARVLDVSLTLYAEHEFNASTFSARVTASTMTDLHSAITAAIGTLKGPLHGGANEAVAEMLLEIGSRDKAERWVREMLAHKQRIMGFGHRVLKSGDSRSDVMQQHAESLSRICNDRSWYEIATTVDRVVQQEKGLYPNLDFYTAVAYLLMGIPRNLYTPVFVCSRITGWCAHVIEQQDHNRLIRPRALYTGPARREYVPLDRRSAVAENIVQVRQMDVSTTMPWSSFADFFNSRISDRTLVDRPFLSYYDDDRQLHRTFTYAEFGTTVQRAATFLHDQVGLRRGDRLATILFNHDVTVVLYFAAWVSGITVVPINVEEPTDIKRFVLEHSEASVVCCWHSDVEEVNGLQRDVPALQHVIVLNDKGIMEMNGHGVRGKKRHSSVVSSQTPHTSSLKDEALIVYTSGTTGQPKGVVLTVENLLIDADAIANWHHFGMNDRLMCVLPIHHVNGMVVTLITPLYCKGSLVLNRKFKSTTFWRRLHDEHVTCVSVVPTLLEFLLDANEDLSSYKLDRFKGLICGAGPLSKETAIRFEDRFHFPICHGYGLSETTCYSCFLPDDLSYEEHRHWLRDYEFPSIGVPLRHNTMTILNDEGQPLPEMSRGEICIRGETVCIGYFKRDDANKAAFKSGWFRSGDEGFYVRDKAGRPFFFISGRLKELIIRGGVNISPFEIDDTLKSHPLVQFAMAVPFEHRYYGEEIAAYVVVRDGISPPTEAELLAHCRRLLPFSKCPKVILFGREVLYTSTGKPKRLELKSRLADTLVAYRDRQFKEEE